MSAYLLSFASVWLCVRIYLRAATYRAGAEDPATLKKEGDHCDA